MSRGCFMKCALIRDHGHLCEAYASNFCVHFLSDFQKVGTLVGMSIIHGGST